MTKSEIRLSTRPRTMLPALTSSSVGTTSHPATTAPIPAPTASR